MWKTSLIVFGTPACYSVTVIVVGIIFKPYRGVDALRIGLSNVYLPIYYETWFPSP